VGSRKNSGIKLYTGLKGATAGPAEARASVAGRATMATVVLRGRRRTGDQENWVAALGRAGPDERGNPADHGPAKKEIEQENPGEITTTMADDRGQEVQRNYADEEEHVPLPGGSIARRALLLMTTHSGPRLFQLNSQAIVGSVRERFP
jgi:hypothetical protein